MVRDPMNCDSCNIRKKKDPFAWAGGAIPAMSRSSAPSLSSGGETRYTRSQYGKETEEQREPWREPKILTFFSKSRNIRARGAG